MEIKENVNATTSAAAVDSLWHDLPMPANTSGKVKYRKPANQNMLEVYVNGITNNSISTNPIIFGPLPLGYRPSSTDGVIMGMIMTDNGTTKKTQFQYLTIQTDGEIFLPSGSSSSKIKNFAFYGIIDL